MNNKFFTLLGFAAKAGKLSFGHDAAKQSIRSGKAKALVVASDASDRLAEEMTGMADGIPVFFSGKTIEETGKILGRRAAVLSVNDVGFSDSLNIQYHTADNKEDNPWQ